MKVYIMRGLPGSGKTRWVQSHDGYASFVSADYYFECDGEYHFDASKLPAAHQACLRGFLRLIMRGVQSIIVDNTNIRAWEISPYLSIAEAYGYDVEIVEVRADVETCCARDVHQVPDETIRKMARVMIAESLPPWWKVTVITSA